MYKWQGSLCEDMQAVMREPNSDEVISYLETSVLATMVSLLLGIGFSFGEMAT